MNDLQQKKVLAEPTKQFFMHMLTRDIELKDAILDLLDNCIDGAMRSKEKPTLESGVPEEYEGYWAKIELTKSHFKISDNCGGISLDLTKLLTQTYHLLGCMVLA